MENRVPQAETGMTMHGVAGIFRETTRVALGMTKIVARESVPELDEGYAAYEAALKMLEKNRLSDLHLGEDQKKEKAEEEHELEQVRTELAAITGNQSEIATPRTSVTTVSPRPAQAAIAQI